MKTLKPLAAVLVLPASAMARISYIGVVIAAAVLGTAINTVAQDVNPGEVLERPEIYSPYVERFQCLHRGHLCAIRTAR